MNYYRYSGDITLGGVLNGLAAGAVSAFILSIPYAYITVYVPLIYLNLLVTLAFGAIPGFLAAKAARAGNLCSPAMYILVGIVCGVFAEYCNWVAWIFAFSRQEALIFHPAGIVAVAAKILPEGTWGMTSGRNITGIPLLCIWIVEAGVIIGMLAYATYHGLVKFICCPQCSKWFDTPTRTLQFAMPERLNEVLVQLKKLQFKCLADLPKIDPAAASRLLAIDLYFCPACSRFGCFTVTSVETVVKKGKSESKEKILVNRMLLPMDRLSELTA